MLFRSADGSFAVDPDLFPIMGLQTGIIMMTIDGRAESDVFKISMFRNFSFDYFKDYIHHPPPVFFSKCKSEIHPADIFFSGFSISGQIGQIPFRGEGRIPFSIEIFGRRIKIITDGVANITGAGMDHDAK